MKYDDLQYLSVQLPEDVLKEKWSGNFDRARRIIGKRLGRNLPTALRRRLELELKNLDDFERCYTVSKPDALAQVRGFIPDLSESEFDELQLEGKIDRIYLNGNEMYLDSFCATLFKSYPDLWTRTVSGDNRDYQIIDDLIASLEVPMEVSCHIHLRHSLWLDPDSVRPGKKLHIHIPVPCSGPEVQNLKIVDITPSPKHVPDHDSTQPTVYFEEVAKKNQVFSVEYSFDNTVTYVDLSQVDLDKVAEASLPKDVLPYLEESLPHIQFSPYLKSLAFELKATETNPLLIARRYYDFITTRTDYRFVRNYACIDNISEYCALNLVGDCGVQSLLFITLCRIANIPAKWQSGIDAKPGDVGQHDWAQFYVPSVGWVYADLSYGGSSYLRGAMERWNYFFGNVDPYRIPINSEFQSDFFPPKKFWRFDPYDNQCGEAEYNDCGVYGNALKHDFKEIDIRRIR